MAYRTYDALDLSIPAKAEPKKYDLAACYGILVGVIASTAAWLLIFGMGYVAWGLLP
jgi:hypothetical protein